MDDIDDLTEGMGVRTHNTEELSNEDAESLRKSKLQDKITEIISYVFWGTIFIGVVLLTGYIIYG